MAGIVDIYNLALGNLSSTGQRIELPTESSTEAKLCQLHYPMALETLLQSHDWNFARARPKLVALANDRSEMWAYRYDASYGDLLAIRRLSDALDDPGFITDRVPYEYIGDAIYTNMADAYLVYTRKIDDVNKFRPMFKDALVASLAARIAFPLTKVESIQQRAEQAALRLVQLAKIADANENFRNPRRVPRHIAARSA